MCTSHYGQGNDDKEMEYFVYDLQLSLRLKSYKFYCSILVLRVAVSLLIILKIDHRHEYG